MLVRFLHSLSVHNSGDRIGLFFLLVRVHFSICTATYDHSQGRNLCCMVVEGGGARSITIIPILRQGGPFTDSSMQWIFSKVARLPIVLFSEFRSSPPAVTDQFGFVHQSVLFSGIYSPDLTSDSFWRSPVRIFFHPKAATRSNPRSCGFYHWATGTSRMLHNTHWPSSVL